MTRVCAAGKFYKAHAACVRYVPQNTNAATLILYFPLHSYFLFLFFFSFDAVVLGFVLVEIVVYVYVWSEITTCVLGERKLLEGRKKFKVKKFLTNATKRIKNQKSNKE